MYLSWDIGIKNLAYCMVEYKDDKASIKHWGIINLSDVDQPKTKMFKCDCIIKSTKKKCNKDALNQDSDGKKYCKTHSKTYGKDKELKKIEYGNKCCYVGKKKCEKNGIYFDKNNNFYCTAHSKKVEGELTKYVKPKKANKIPLIDIGTRLFLILDQHPEFKLAETVMLENQPVYKNPTMKSVQMLLYSYFIIRCKIDDPNSTMKDLVLMSARNKLKAYLGEPITDYDHLKNEYNKTKKLGIRYCQEMLKDDKYWLDYFNNYEKNKGKGVLGNDDLADTYLMNIYYIYKKHKIIK
jgi:hypothetical protein